MRVSACRERDIVEYLNGNGQLLMNMSVKPSFISKLTLRTSPETPQRQFSFNCCCRPRLSRCGTQIISRSIKVSDNWCWPWQIMAWCFFMRITSEARQRDERKSINTSWTAYLEFQLEISWSGSERHLYVPSHSISEHAI
jgi:hypothetical protein